MTRTGDLMQRESIITTNEDRVATANMANQVGEALEMVSKATGAVAHLYKTQEWGPNPGKYRIHPKQFDANFLSLIKETGSIVNCPDQPIVTRPSDVARQN